jgi:apolipoprotein N-acyltransferase
MFTKSTLLQLGQIVLGVALGGLSAVMLLLAMPPRGWWPLALFGFAPMLLAQHRVLPARLSGLGQAIGVGGFLGLFFRDLFSPALQLPAYVQLLPVLVGAIAFLTSSAGRALHARTGYRWFVLEGAAVWVGIEMIRNLVPVLGTGGFIGYAYAGLTPLLQPASLVGIFGLEWLVMLAAYTVALAGLWLYDRAFAAGGALKVPAPLVRRWGLSTAAAVAAWCAASLALFAWPVRTPSVRVAAVQPARSDFGRLVALTRAAAGQGVQVFVWPEGALRFDPQVEHTAELQALARDTGAYLVLGVGLRTLQGLRNEATVLSPEGAFLGTAGKDHPMTYLGESSLTRGQYPVYAASFGALASIICFDLNFNDTARKLGARGAQLLAVPSNDWPGLSAKQVAYLRLRAIENRVAAIKADGAYGSMVFDSHGRLVAQHVTDQPSEMVLVADVPLGDGRAPAARVGDALGWLALAGLVFFSLPNPIVSGKRAAVRRVARPA